MFCTKCGKIIAEDAKFCANCGYAQTISKETKRSDLYPSIKRNVNWGKILSLAALLVVGGSFFYGKLLYHSTWGASRRERAEEERKKNSPEYCIENNLFLSDAALTKLINEVNYFVDTGNKIKDEEMYRQHHGRFMGKRIKVRGTIKQIETTLFTDEVKVIVNVVGGKTISARFDGMSKDEAINLNRGDAILFEGDVSDRPVTSTIAMDRCAMTR